MRIDNLLRPLKCFDVCTFLCFCKKFITIGALVLVLVLVLVLDMFSPPQRLTRDALSRKAETRTSRGARPQGATSLSALLANSLTTSKAEATNG